MPEQRLLTISQAAARLGVHQNTLRQWTDKGLVPHVKLPSGHRRFTVAAIEQLRRQMGLEPDAGKVRAAA
jgi:excisionase family DNA binding protein